MRRQALRIAALLVAGLALACGDAGRAARRGAPQRRARRAGRERRRAASPPSPRVVDDARLRGADADVGDWLTNGRTYSEQRFSPLDQINAENVGRMHEVVELRDRPRPRPRGDADRASTACCTSPARGAWCSRSTRARASSSGSTTRRSRRSSAQKACCDVVNRGVALYKGRVYVGALDGRLSRSTQKTGRAGLGGRHRRPVAARTPSPARRASSRAR